MVTLDSVLYFVVANFPGIVGSSANVRYHANGHRTYSYLEPLATIPAFSVNWLFYRRHVVILCRRLGDHVLTEKPIAEVAHNVVTVYRWNDSWYSYWTSASTDSIFAEHQPDLHEWNVVAVSVWDNHAKRFFIANEFTGFEFTEHVVSKSGHATLTNILPPSPHENTIPSPIQD